MQMLLRRDAGIRELRRLFHVEKKKDSRREESESLSLAKSDEARKQNPNALFALERKRGGKGKQLTTSGSLALALRCVLSSSAANKVGLALLEDVSKFKVNAAVNLLAASLLQRSRAFHRDCSDVLQDVRKNAFAQGQGIHQIIAIAWSSDATNAAVWRKSKVHTTEIYAKYIEDVNMLKTASLGECARSLFTVCDLQRVLSGTTESTYSLLRKQLLSAGCPLWPEVFPKDLSEALSFETHWPQMVKNAQDSKSSLTRIFMYTADGGPDQQKFKRALETSSLNSLDCLFLAFPCVLHAGALISKGGLLTVDTWLSEHDVKWRLFSATAKIIHVWRDDARNVFRSWSRNFGPELALEHARSLPPCAISGRWKMGVRLTSWLLPGLDMRWNIASSVRTTLFTQAPEKLM